MADNNLTTYEATRVSIRPKGRNYVVSNPFNNEEIRLERDIHFGTIPGTQSPSLYKAGAEYIAWLLGLMRRTTVEYAIRDYEKPFFYYEVKCELYKVVDGKEYCFATGYGSANTTEKSTGKASAFDTSNSALKKAEKRAFVDAVISCAGLSAGFTQDVEDMAFMNKANDLIKTADPKSTITTEQGRVIYAIGASKGMNANMVKAWLKKYGINSTKEITQEQYETILETLKDYEVTENEA